MTLPRFQVAFRTALLAVLAASTACHPFSSRANSIPGLAASSRFSERSLLPVVRIWAWRGDDGDPYRSGFATAVFIRSDGVLITNSHVVDGSKRVHIFLENGAIFPARVIGIDPLTDLALVKIVPRGAATPRNTNGDIEFPVIRWGDSERILPGDPVYAVGHPFGLHRSVSLGIVSARPEPPPELSGLENWLQTDASINPGNSGGPILNSNGEMIGLASAILTRSGGSQGVGFAVPSRAVRRISEILLEKGQVERGWMGITGQKLNPDLARHFLPSNRRISPLNSIPGVLVAQIHPAGPAQGKLKPGDILLQLDGKTIAGPSSLRVRIQEAKPGEPLRFHGIRDGKPFQARLTASHLPSIPGLTVPSAPRAGAIAPEAGDASPLADRPIGLRLGRDAERRITILSVVPGSPAFLAGLMKGDRILGVDGKAPRTAEEIQQILGRSSTRPTVLWIERPSQGRIYVALHRG